MSAPGAPNDDVVRPFQCPQCGSRYTRQEHLSRHQQARHSDIKEFVCATCNKGFARRDILRRHELGHQKNKTAAASNNASGDDSAGGKAKPKVERKPTARKRASAAAAAVTLASAMEGENGDLAMEGPPAKVLRAARACVNCSKSKLRCDGELPCSRCKRGGVECSFLERPNFSTAAADYASAAIANHLVASKSPSSRSEEGESASLGGGDSGEEDGGGYGVGVQGGMIPPHPAWGHLIGGPYGMPLRPPSHGPLSHPQHLPPSSFQTMPMPLPMPMGSMGIGSPQHHQHYYSRPPDQFNQPGGYRQSSPYPQLPPNLYHLQGGPGQSQPFGPGGIPPLPALPQNISSPAAASSPWDTGAYGRTSTSTGDPGLGHVDFLDMIANNGGSSNDSSEIDWALLNSGYTPGQGVEGEGREDIEGDQPNGYDGHVGESPGTTEIEASLLGAAVAASTSAGAIQQQNSNLRNALDNSPPAPAPPQPFDAPPSADPTSSSSSTSVPTSLPSAPLYAPIPTPIPSRLLVSSNHESATQDSAAETLLQLASHTPRASPEPSPAPRDSSGEYHRSSQPVHNFADPWPLSYQPREKTERLDQGASRAASPRPPGMGSLANCPQHVPALTAETRARVLDKVRDIFGEAERFLPRLELLDLFVQLYFDRYSALLPTLHRPTWDPNVCPSFLVVAVASVGARYAFDRVAGAKMHAQALLETARRMLQVMGDMDNTLLRTVAWQQANLIVLHTGLAIGNKRDLERTQAYSSMPITFARRQGWFKEPKIDEGHEMTFSLEERWRRWRDREEIKRLGFAALVFDSMGTALWNHESSSLYLDAAKTTLPCHDSLWEAPTATAWQSLFRGSLLPQRGLETLSAINLLTDRSHHSSEALLSCSRDVFATTVLMCTLHALGWAKEHETNVMGLFLPAAAGFDGQGGGEGEPVKAALDAGLEFFQDRVILPPEMQALLPDGSSSAANGSGGGSASITAASTMALLTHVTAMTQRLPLRLLQPLARTGDQSPSPDILASISRWVLASSGSIARTTIYHAGQLFALALQTTPSGSDTPLEPFALFYAALAVLAWSREQPRAEGGDEGKEQVRLDRLMDRSDPTISSWIQGAPATAYIEEVGDLSTPGAGVRVIRLAARKLTGLKVWRVGELLGRTLVELANEEERREAEGQNGSGGQQGGEEVVKMES